MEEGGVVDAADFEEVVVGSEADGEVEILIVTTTNLRIVLYNLALSCIRVKTIWFANAQMKKCHTSMPHSI